MNKRLLPVLLLLLALTACGTTETPSLTPSASPSPTNAPGTVRPTPTQAISPTLDATQSPSQTAQPSPTPSLSPSPSASPSSTATPTPVPAQKLTEGNAAVTLSASWLLTTVDNRPVAVAPDGKARLKVTSVTLPEQVTLSTYAQEMADTTYNLLESSASEVITKPTTLAGRDAFKISYTYQDRQFATFVVRAGNTVYNINFVEISDSTAVDMAEMLNSLSIKE